MRRRTATCFPHGDDNGRLRKLATGVPGYREFHDATVLVPFTGEGVFQGLRELSPWAVVIGVTLTVVLRVFHGTLFGS